jgi:tRNA (uracil-5-)-methyltransferase
LRRLVYVSCNPETMAANCADLCTPQGPDGTSGGAPFRPVRAMAVDLFPHTPHCEAVLLLER